MNQHEIMDNMTNEELETFFNKDSSDEEKAKAWIDAYKRCEKETKGHLDDETPRIRCFVSENVYNQEEINRQMTFELYSNNDVGIYSNSKSLENYEMHICAWDLPYMIRSLQKIYDEYIDRELNSKGLLYEKKNFDDQ